MTAQKTPRTLNFAQRLPSSFYTFNLLAGFKRWHVFKTLSAIFEKHVVLFKFGSTFVATVHATLPVRSASQGVSFALIAIPVALHLADVQPATSFNNFKPVLQTFSFVSGLLVLITFPF